MWNEWKIENLTPEMDVVQLAAQKMDHFVGFRISLELEKKHSLHNRVTQRRITPRSNRAPDKLSFKLNGININYLLSATLVFLTQSNGLHRLQMNELHPAPL